MKLATVIRGQIGVQDLCLGEGQVEQTRQNRTVTLSKLNSSGLLYSDTQTVKQILVSIDATLTALEAQND